MDSISFGTDISGVGRESTAAADQFHETAASPDSLSYFSRGSVIIRDAREPIQFPFLVQEVAGELI